MVAYNSATNETYMFWKEANPLQSMFGVYGQKFSANGTRMWNDEGKIFKAMDNNSYASLSAIAYENRVMVYYNELPFLDSMM